MWNLKTKKVKLKETETRMVIAQGQGVWEVGKGWLKGTNFSAVR